MPQRGPKIEKQKASINKYKLVLIKIHNTFNCIFEGILYSEYDIPEPRQSTSLSTFEPWPHAEQKDQQLEEFF